MLLNGKKMLFNGFENHLKAIIAFLTKTPVQYHFELLTIGQIGGRPIAAG